jgi:hypothetical protein
MVLAPGEEDVLAGRGEGGIERGEAHRDDGRFLRRQAEHEVAVGGVEVIDRGAEKLERGLVILRARQGAGRCVAVIGQFLDGVAHDHAEAVADAGAGDTRFFNSSYRRVSGAS